MAKHDIIVIGASAGGVNALVQIVSDLPATLNASVLVVLHIPPQNFSLLPDILQKHTRLIITHPKNGQTLRHRSIYIAPPDYHMIIQQDCIYLTKAPRVNHSRPAIDPLFRSAAIHYGKRVVGIVLTGSLDDGTVGLEFIKKHGGLAVIQNPDEAEYPDMPRHALENVKIDHCLSLSEIATFIAKMANTVVKTNTKPAAKLMQVEEAKQLKKTIPATEESNQLGTVSAFTCPECHGTLWEINEDRVLRYRCRIGHAYSANNLLAAHDETTENILWTAVRTLEENAELSERIVLRNREKHIPIAVHFKNKAKLARQNASKLKEMLLQKK